MEQVLCKNCAWFRKSYTNPKVAFCYNPGAKTDVVDLVFGYTTYYQCDAMRKVPGNQCGPEAAWFKPKSEPRFEPAPNVQNSNRESEL